MDPMFNNFENKNEELNFLLKQPQITHTSTVLEWGSGGSTIHIAPNVKELHSIEYNMNWYDRVKAEAPANVKLHYVPKNKEEMPGHDGTEEEYYDYVHFPATLGILFDLIFIDGRARVACAREAVKLLKPGGCILIHDYKNPSNTPGARRPEYEVVEDFLQVEGFEYALYKFIPKMKPMGQPFNDPIVQPTANPKMEPHENIRNQGQTTIPNYQSPISQSPNLPPPADCWHNAEGIRYMNKFFDEHIATNNPEVVDHLAAFTELLRTTGEHDVEIMDLGCGTAMLSTYCKPFKYLGADLPNVIAGVSMRNHPELFYRSCDIISDDLSWLQKYPVVVVNGVIDIMQYPLQILEKILPHIDKWLIVHRQEITKAGETGSIQKPSYGGFTWHSFINREEFLNTVRKHGFDVYEEKQLNFSDWEDNGNSFLLKRRPSFALYNMDHKLGKYFNNKENGFYVEAGANNGVTQSNTSYFQVFYNWHGLLIEPIKEQFEQIFHHRPANAKNYIINAALVASDYPGDTITMYNTWQNNSLMSVVADSQATEKLARLNGEHFKEEQVPARSFNAIADKLNSIVGVAIPNNNIDLFVLDVEGYELNALKGIDLNRFNVHYFLVEELQETDDIQNYLAQYGYKRIEKLSENDWLYGRSE
jgi:FkbM family methyltransferase